MYVVGLVLWSFSILLGLFELVFTDRAVARNERQRRETFDRYGEDHRGWHAILFFSAPSSRPGVRWHGLFLVASGVSFLLLQVGLWHPAG